MSGLAGVSYVDIPQTMRDLLDVVYMTEGVEMWWNARNRNLDGRSAAEMWQDYEGRGRVRSVVEHLTGGAW